MNFFTFYDPNTGEIKANGAGAIVGVDSLSRIDGYYSKETHYVDVLRNQVADRPSMNIVVNKNTIKADSSEEAIISNIPTGCSMTHDGETHQMSDNLLEFTADHVGVYTFLFEKFPYKPVTISVEATS